MKSFKRIFKYILPQWPRVIAVILSAMVVAVLLSMSFATVIPMLKVMMGEEGLHVWVDRKMSNHRYGVEIYLPGRLDYANKDLAHYLELTDVEPNSGAHISRLRRKDEIIAAGDSFTLPLDEKFSSDELLKILAEAPLDGQLKLLVRRFDEKAGTSEQIKLTLNPKSAERKAFESWAYNTKADMLDLLRKAVSLMPRATSKSDTAKTIVYIIIAPWVYNFFFPEYLEAVYYSRLYALSSIPLCFSVISLIFKSKMMTKQVYQVKVIGPIVKILLSIALIPTYGILGAVLSVIFARTFNVVMYLILFKKI